MTDRTAGTGVSDKWLARLETLADSLSSVEQEPYIRGDTTWMTRAACREADPDLFQPLSENDKDTIAAALAVCARCSVHASCRQWRYDIGAVGCVMGGVYYSPDARGKRPCIIQGCTKPVRSGTNPFCSFEHEHSVKVGTEAGLRLHRARSEAGCPACLEAGRRASTRKNLGSGGSRSVSYTHSGARVSPR